MVYPSLETGVFQHMVSENEFAAPSSHDFEMILTNQIFELLESWLVGHQIVARRVEPKALESGIVNRSEEHTSELQSQSNLVCRLLLEKNQRIVHERRPDDNRQV